ncbi:MAG: hypothetical protein MZV63_52085 [Marinilabiliales bacterium]|nr:hypothetical protein [Marinilabiliales bacterium]
MRSASAGRMRDAGKEIIEVARFHRGEELPCQGKETLKLTASQTSGSLSRW